MFAGPNGSGKSTIKSVIAPELLGIYINSDEIELEISANGFLDISPFGVATSAEEILGFFRASTLLANARMLAGVETLRFEDGRLIFGDIEVNSYLASVVSDFLRYKLLDAGMTFTFETVMSHPSKIAFLQDAQAQGFRTYLYYVATEDPAINVVRVRNRETLGGHPVPELKIVARYHRSLALLADAVQFANRAYIFDNSSHEQTSIWIAEITDGEVLKMKTDRMPAWFKTALWDKFVAEEPSP